MRYSLLETGNAFASEARLPPIMREYVLYEKLIVLNAISALKCDTLLELGCMWGRLLECSLIKKIEYEGWDASEAYLALARDLASYGTSPKFTNVDLDADLSAVSKFSGLRLDNQMLLIVAPFNIIGNLTNINEFSSWARGLCCPLMIFTYQEDEHALGIVLDYFKKATGSDLSVDISQKSVQFRDQSGISRGKIWQASLLQSLFPQSIFFDIGPCLRVFLLNFNLDCEVIFRGL